MCEAAIDFSNIGGINKAHIRAHRGKDIGLAYVHASWGHAVIVLLRIEWEFVPEVVFFGREYI